MPKKVKTKHVKPITRQYNDPDPISQFTVRKDIEDDRKVKEKDVFEGKKKTVKARKKKR
jgi:hypothetical protein